MEACFLLLFFTDVADLAAKHLDCHYSCRIFLRSCCFFPPRHIKMWVPDASVGVGLWSHSIPLDHIKQWNGWALFSLLASATLSSSKIVATARVFLSLILYYPISHSISLSWCADSYGNINTTDTDPYAQNVILKIQILILLIFNSFEIRISQTGTQHKATKVVRSCLNDMRSVETTFFFCLANCKKKSISTTACFALSLHARHNIPVCFSSSQLNELKHSSKDSGHQNALGWFASTKFTPYHQTAIILEFSEKFIHSFMQWSPVSLPLLLSRDITPPLPC